MQRGFQLLLPIHTEYMIPADDSVRLLNELLEELDYTKLYQTYQRKVRSISPITMFKILVYGYMNGIYSSRGLEQACRRDVNFMWLLEGQRSPDHNTIARFRSERMVEVIEGLFYQLVKKLQERKEIRLEHLYVDGTKIEANANRYSFVWKGAVEKNEQKLAGKIEAFLEEVNQRYGDLGQTCSLAELLEVLQEQATKQDVKFVQGKGCRKSQLQRDIEVGMGLLERQQKYAGYQETFGKRRSFSKTDRDATFMRMKEDHMKNGQLKPGYNVQIGVEGEYIVGMGVYQQATDSGTLIPLLEEIKKQTGSQSFAVVADAGYESEENYVYLEQSKQDCYIKPANYEISKQRKYKRNPYRIENLMYDETKDVYICPDNKQLKVAFCRRSKSKTGFEAIHTVYECESCENCSHRQDCHKGKGNRRIQVSKQFQKLREKGRKQILTSEGILLRINRSIQVEGAFGVLKEDYGFRRFLMRGNQKVVTETLLMGIAYNVRKYHAKKQQNRLGTYLFEPNTA